MYIWNPIIVLPSRRSSHRGAVSAYAKKLNYYFIRHIGTKPISTSIWNIYPNPCTTQHKLTKIITTSLADMMNPSKSEMYSMLLNSILSHMLSFWLVANIFIRAVLGQKSGNRALRKIVDVKYFNSFLSFDFLSKCDLFSELFPFSQFKTFFPNVWTPPVSLLRLVFL